MTIKELQDLSIIYGHTIVSEYDDENDEVKTLFENDVLADFVPVVFPADLHAMKVIGIHSSMNGLDIQVAPAD